MEAEDTVSQRSVVSGQRPPRRTTPFRVSVEMAGVLLIASALGLLFNAINPLGTDLRPDAALSARNEAARTQHARRYLNQTLALSFESFVSGVELVPVPSSIEPTFPDPKKAYWNETRLLSFSSF